MTFFIRIMPIRPGWPTGRPECPASFQAAPDWALVQGPFWQLSPEVWPRSWIRPLSEILRTRSGGVVGAPVAVLACAASPAVLVEVGYLSKPGGRTTG